MINEIDSDTPGTDVLEFIELYDGGSGQTSLDGYVLVFYNGSNDVSYRTISLDGYQTNHSGYFLLGNEGLIPVPDLIFPNGGLQNGADAVALYTTGHPSFPNGTEISLDGLADAIVYDTGDADDPELLVLLNPGQPQVDEDRNGDKDNQSLQRFPNGTGGLRNTDTYIPRIPTPGASNGETLETVEIFDIQSDGAVSPFVNQSVSLSENIVTGVCANGFFMQTPEARSDADPATSDGIFVYTGSEPQVSVGDLVNCSGTVEEFYESTQINQVTDLSVQSSGYRLPPVTDLDESLPSPEPGTDNELECLENMRVRIYDGIICEATDGYGDVRITASDRRSFREQGLPWPGQTDLPVWDGNPEIFELNPDGLGLSNHFFFSGSVIDSTVGILAYSFGDFQIWPEAVSISFEDTLRPVEERNDEEMTIATQNCERLFDMNDDPGKDDAVPDEETYLTKLSKLSDHIVTLLKSPDILALQEVENLAVLESLAELIRDEYDGPEYEACLEEGNDIGGIDVGFLISPNFHADSVRQYASDENFEVNTVSYTLHDRPPLALFGYPASHPSFYMAIINLHLRSLSGIDGGDSLRIREKRQAQALSVAQIVQEIQTLHPAWHLVVLGDFNAYEFTDGLVDVLGQITGNPNPAGALFPATDIVHPDLTNQVLSIPSFDRYSYVYEGNAQCLDHLLTSENLASSISDIAFTRGNADAPAAYKSIRSTPARCSDHDGIVLTIHPDETGIHDRFTIAHPASIELLANYPNPFNMSTSISYALPASAHIRLFIFNSSGEKIRTLWDGEQKAGSWIARWDGTSDQGHPASSGIYFLVLSTRDQRLIQKLCLLK